MTYTFKLSRRLALAHISSMLACLAFLFACSGSDLTDASSTNDPAFTGIEISPSQVVLEPNQQLSLKTLRHSVGGASTFDWTTSGGTISSSGMFSAAKAGTYTLIANRHHGGHRSGDTTVVVVTPTPPSLVG